MEKKRCDAILGTGVAHRERGGGGNLKSKKEDERIQKRKKGGVFWREIKKKGQ